MADNYSYSCLIANLSVDSITPTIWTPQRTSFYNSYFVVVILLSFIIIGAPWNAYVIINIFRKRLSTQPTMMLLLSLAISDLLICILVLPVTVITGLADDFVFGGTDYIRCQVCQFGLLYSIFTYSSLNTLALLSVDRFLYIWKPLRYKRIMTVKSVLLMIATAWLWSIAISITPLFGFGTFHFSRLALTCTVSFIGYSRLAKNTSYLILLVTAGLVPVLIMVVTNVWVFCIAQKSIRNHYKLMTQQKYVDDLRRRVNKERNQRQLKLIKTFIVVLITNIVTWIPVSVILIARAAYEPGPSFPTDARVFLVSFPNLALLSQSVVHPIVETHVLFGIKEKMRKVFRKIRDKYCFKCCITDCCTGEEDNTSNRCCGKHCVFLEVFNAAFLPVSEMTSSRTNIP